MNVLLNRNYLPVILCSLREGWSAILIIFSSFSEYLSIWLAASCKCVSHEPIYRGSLWQHDHYTSNNQFKKKINHISLPWRMPNLTATTDPHEHTLNCFISKIWCCQNKWAFQWQRMHLGKHNLLCNLSFGKYYHVTAKTNNSYSKNNNTVKILFLYQSGPKGLKLKLSTVSIS